MANARVSAEGLGRSSGPVGPSCKPEVIEGSNANVSTEQLCVGHCLRLNVHD